MRDWLFLSGGSLLDEADGFGRVGIVLEAEDGGEFAANRVSNEKVEIDARFRKGSRDGVAKAGSIVALDVDRGNAGGRESGRLSGICRLLGRDWKQLHGRVGAIAGITIAHNNLKVGASLGEWLQSFRKGAGAVLEFFPPQRNLFDFDWHGESSNHY